MKGKVLGERVHFAHAGAAGTPLNHPHPRMPNRATNHVTLVEEGLTMTIAGIQ